MEWEKLIFLIIVVLGSVISTYFQNKKKREDEELENRAPNPKPITGQPPVPHWPRTGRDWQEELRRVLQGKLEPPPTHQQTLPPKANPPRGVVTVPPPIVRTKVVLPATPGTRPEPSEGDVSFPNPLKQSSTAYARASQLAGRVESRLQAIDRQTETHKRAELVRRTRPSGAAVARRWTRNRESLREAFIASLIFAPPTGLRD